MLNIIWFETSKEDLLAFYPQEDETHYKPHHLRIKTFIYLIGTWTLIFTNLVPISLLVTLEMIKYLQGKFIAWDHFIYDTKMKTHARVQTSTLNEELGQVQFIFSDKTGTLTKNYMEFARLSVGDQVFQTDRCYSGSPRKIKDTLSLLITNFNCENKELKNLIDNLNENDYNIDNIYNHYFLNLALCHSIIIENKRSKEIQDNKQNETRLNYQSSSPDELALVNAARYFDYIFSERDSSNNIYIQIKGKKIKFQILNLIEYSSER